jgi:hypothetical protein
MLFALICASAIHTENIIAVPFQERLDVRATMLRHTVYSKQFSVQTQDCYCSSSCTIQCHLEVLTYCYEKRTRGVVPSRRHSLTTVRC